MWLPRLEELKLIKIIKPRDPTKDGPPIVTKASLLQARKEMRILSLSKPKKR